MTGVGHLARRFLTSLWARPPSAQERAWVRGVLEPGELALWDRLPRYDRRHTLLAARRTGDALRAAGAEPESRWLGAALLHDVGKLEAGLGLGGRVVATLAIQALGRERTGRWAGGLGLRGRIGRYARHAAIGGGMIRDAGGREEVARWAEVHHDRRLMRSVAGIPPKVVEALRTADRA